MEFTHICIETPTQGTTNGLTPLIKKGDFTTLKGEKACEQLKSGVGYEIHQHLGVMYCASLFLPLPPQKEKIVYVSVPETIIEPEKADSLN